MARNIFQRKGRPGWYIQVVHNGRKIVKGSYSTPAMAQIALAELRRDLERGDLGLPKRCRMTLKQFAEERYLPWARVHKRSWVSDQYLLRGKILPKVGSLLLPDVTRDRVERYLKDRLREVRPSSANREGALLRRMLGLAMDWGLVDQNPLARLKLYREPPARCPSLSREDEARLLAASPAWLRRVIVAALLTGCRQGELRNLLWRHVDFDQGQIVIANSKSGRPRVIPLHPYLEAELRRERGLPDGHVFTIHGRPICKDTCSETFRRVARRLGLSLTFHDLRHIAATRMLAQGCGLLQIADLLGHATLSMTRRYAAVGFQDKQRTIMSLPAPAGASEEVA